MKTVDSAEYYPWRWRIFRKPRETVRIRTTNVETKDEPMNNGSVEYIEEVAVYGGSDVVVVLWPESVKTTVLQD